MPVRIRRLIGFVHGILHTRCIRSIYALLSLRHHMIHFIKYMFWRVSQAMIWRMLRWRNEILLDGKLLSISRRSESGKETTKTRRIRFIRLHDILRVIAKLWTELGWIFLIAAWDGDHPAASRVIDCNCETKTLVCDRQDIDNNLNFPLIMQLWSPMTCPNSMAQSGPWKFTSIEC